MDHASATRTESRAPWWRKPFALGAATVAATGPYPITNLCIVATCILAPSYTIRWHYGPLPTTLLETSILITVAAFVVEWNKKKADLYWRTAVVAPTVLFLVAGTISVVVAPDHRAALGLYRAYIIEPIAFGFVLVNVITTPQRAYLVVMGLALGGLGAGVANSAVVLDALRHHAYDVVNTPPVVIYNTANAVALYLVPLIGATGAMALHWPSQRQRILAIAFTGVATICVLLSFSRGGYLALAVVAAALALSHPSRWRLLVAGVVAAGLLMLSSTIRQRVLTELDFSNGHNTLVGRFHLWSAALQMLRDHPLFGAGLSGFATVIGPYWNRTNIDRFTYPHNILLNFWTETGLLGALAFFAILVIGFVSAWRGYRRSERVWRPVHLGVLLALTAVVVHGLVDVPYWKNDLSLEFWAILSLTLLRAPVPSSFRL